MMYDDEDYYDEDYYEPDEYVYDDGDSLVGINDIPNWLMLQILGELQLQRPRDDTGEEHATFMETCENGFSLDGNIESEEELQILVREHRDSNRTKCNIQEVAARFASLFDDRTSTDIILSVNGTRYHAHRLILCLWSTVFHKMLEDSECFASSLTTDDESQCDVLHLVESEEDAQVFDEFLKFFYTETATFHMENIWQVVSLANKYNVVELFKSCGDLLIQYVKTIPLDEELIEILKVARFWSMDDLQSEVWQIILSNIYFSLEKFLLLPLEMDTLCEILESSDLVLENEYELLMKLVPFLEKLADENDEASLRRVIDLIRFTEMSGSQLEKVAQLTITKFVRPKIKEALFHRCFLWEKEEIVTGGEGPRCYLSPPPPYFESQSNINDDSFLDDDKDWKTFHTQSLADSDLGHHEMPYEYQSTRQTSRQCFVYRRDKRTLQSVFCASPTAISICKTGEKITIKSQISNGKLANAVEASATVIAVTHNKDKDSVHAAASTKVPVEIDIDKGRMTFKKKAFSISLKRVDSKSKLYFSIFVMARL